MPEARLYIGRLMYLAAPAALGELAQRLREIPELYLQSEIAQAVATGELNRILALGANAAQAVAQPLTMATYATRLTRRPSSKLDLHSMAILKMNGLTFEYEASLDQTDELLRFANEGGSKSLMTSHDPLIKELVCLHGMGPPRHQMMLETALDEAEDISVDAVQLMEQSLYG